LFVVFVVLVFCCADFFVCAITTLADSSQQPKSRNQKERDFIKGLQSHETL
jgi:Ca2+/Na+ antiporter